MFRSLPRIVGRRFVSLENYVENEDFFNSELIYRLRTLPVSLTVEITRFEYRIDLISQFYYQNINYSPLILLYNDISILDLTKGRILNLFSQTDLESLII